MKASAAHGILLIGFLILATALPFLNRWPLYLLAPLLAYGAAIMLLPALRRSVPRLSPGKLNGVVAGATAAIILVSSAALVGFHFILKPDEKLLARLFPGWMLVAPLLGGLLFSTVNAVLEELIFRGLVLESLRSFRSWPAALLAQALIFGLFHFYGYPPGYAGAALAFIYGLMLGWLKQFSQGLLAPIVAHSCADATIFILVSHSLG